MISTHILSYKEICLYENKIKMLIYLVLINSFDCVITQDIINEYYEKLKDYILIDKAIVIGTILDGSLIGFLWAYEISILEERRFHISFLCVDPNHQGKGIADLLWRAIENISTEKGIKTLETLCSTKNEHGMKFYKKIKCSVERHKFVKKLD